MNHIKKFLLAFMFTAAICTGIYIIVQLMWMAVLLAWYYAGGTGIIGVIIMMISAAMATVYTIDTMDGK